MKAWCDSENTIKTFDFYTNMTLFMPLVIHETCYYLFAVNEISVVVFIWPKTSQAKHNDSKFTSLCYCMFVCVYFNPKLLKWLV